MIWVAVSYYALREASRTRPKFDTNFIDPYPELVRSSEAKTVLIEKLRLSAFQ